MKVACAALLVVGLAAGCGNSGKSAQSTTTTKTTTATATTTTTTKVVTHGRYHYPPVLVANYMKSCVGAAGGGSKKRAYCACTLDKLSNNVSTADFAEIGLSHGRIPPRIKRYMSRAIAACAGKL